MSRPLVYVALFCLLAQGESFADSTVLFLHFDGQTVSKASTDDATTNQSAICAVDVPPAELSRLGAETVVREDIVAQVDDYFADYDLVVTASRPSSGSYHMIVVGGLPAICNRGEGVGGLSQLDCDNRSANNVGFVFEGGLTAPFVIALAAAHEMGHMLGLPHTLDECDLMSNFYCADKVFAKEEVDVAPDPNGLTCGLSKINPHTELLKVLGARPSGPNDAGPDGIDVDAISGDATSGDAAAAPGGGCSVGRGGLGGRFSTPFWLLFLLVWRKKQRTNMGILDELTSATGNKQSNTELVKRCLQTPALLHTVAEGLRTGTPKARIDCAMILHEVAKRRPDLLSTFVTDFVDASKDGEQKGGSKKIAKLGFAGLSLLTPVQPAEIFAERSYLFEVAKAGGTLGIEAASVLAALCKNNTNYRGKLLANLVRVLVNIEDKELPKWVAAIGPAVEGSADGYKRLEQTIADRKDALPEAATKKIDRLLVKLERTTVKRKK